MTFYISFYLSIYLINLLFLQYLLKTTFSDRLTLKSLPYILYYIEQYSKIKYTYYGLILALTGIPPFLLFFIKFNFLIATIGKVGFGMFYIVFLILFLNMLYYIQGFYLKNVDFNLNNMRLKSKTKITFNKLFIINFFLGLLYLGVFFYPDFYNASILIF